MPHFLPGLYPSKHSIHDDCDEQVYNKHLNKIHNCNGKNLIKNLRNKGYKVGFSATQLLVHILALMILHLGNLHYFSFILVMGQILITG